MCSQRISRVIHQYKFLVTPLEHSLLTALPTPPPTILFRFEQTLHFCQIIFFILSLNISECFVSMLYSFAISASHCAPKGSAEQSTFILLVPRLAHNLVIELLASPPTILFLFEQPTVFLPVLLFHIYFRV